MKLLRHVLGMFTADFIIIGQNDGVFPFKMLYQAVLEFLGPHGVARSGKSDFDKIIGILLTFGEKNCFRFHYLREAIGNERNSLEIPYPAAIAIWSPLPERLGIFEAAYLKHQLVIFVRIVVDFSGRFPALFRNGD